MAASLVSNALGCFVHVDYDFLFAAILVAKLSRIGLFWSDVFTL